MSRLNKIRQSLKMSQSKLAKLLGCSQSNLARIESGEYKISVDQILVIKKLCEENNIPFELEMLL